MSSDLKKSRRRLVWRIQPQAVAAEHLLHSNGRELREYESTDKVAVLYAECASEPPIALTWLDYCEDGSDRRLLHETDGRNRFDAWFARNRDADVWTLATVWQFYCDWVNGFNVPYLEDCLTLKFDPDPFLDQLFASSLGWILWDFQVELICRIALGHRGFARYVANAWRTQCFEETLISLPDEHVTRNRLLPGILRERSWKERHGRIMYFGTPDLRLACALQNLP